MIQINLLDQTGSKAARTSTAPLVAGGPRSNGNGGGLGAMLVPVFILAMLLVNGGLGWMAWQNVSASNRQYAEVQLAQRKVKTEISKKMDQAEQIKKYREVVANQMDVLKSLDPSDRILWCEKLNMLSDLVPQNVFLAEVKINEDVKMVETAQSKAAREKWEQSKDKTKLKEPPMVQKPVISYIVRLTGLALGKDNVEQMQNVTAFHRAITEFAEKDTRGAAHRFMDGFNNNIEFESVEATTYEGTPVNKFIFKLTTKPMGEDSPKTAADATKKVAFGVNVNGLDLAKNEEKKIAAN
jgi:hypothetical protein